MNTLVVSTITSIDEANRQDPTDFDGQPLALIQGQAASRWLDELCTTPSAELRLAVRAHHLRRWEIARSDYPSGRAGYLRWRRENKAHQATSLGDLMADDGWSDSSIAYAKLLLGRTQLRSHAETQALEDAACLVFLETQFDAMAERTPGDRLVGIVTKTLKKMSPSAVTLASAIGLSTTAQAVLANAAAMLGTEDSDDE